MPAMRPWRLLSSLLAGALLAGLSVAPEAAVADRIPQLEVPPARYAETVTDSDVLIPMSDDVQLLADVIRPAGAEDRRLPVIVTMTPYNKRFITSTVADGELVRRGFVQVVVDARGTGGSPGQWRSLAPREQRDYVEVLAWARKQEWSNGKLGTTGPSYMAINQLLVAERRPPGLKAIFPTVPAGDIYRDVVWHGGEVDVTFIPLWIGLVTALGTIPPVDAGPAVADWALSFLLLHWNFPAQAMREGILGGDLAYDGPFYSRRSPLGRVERIEVPTFIVGGLWDLFQRSEPLLYQRLRLPPGQKQFLTGPWYHVTLFLGGDTELGEGAHTPQDIGDLEVLWFDRWLKGHRNGIDSRFGPVTPYELGTERWARERTWPPPVRHRRLYLAPPPSGSKAGALRRSEPEGERTITLQPNPLAGACSRTLMQWTIGLAELPESCVENNAAAEVGAATFTTRPVKERTQIAGPLSVHLRGSTSTRDGYWVAEITDVAPDGTSRQISAGYLLMSRRALDESRSVYTPAGDLAIPYHPFTRESRRPVRSGTPYPLDVEIFTTNLVLKRGHSLRLVLRTSDYPHAAPTLPDALRLGVPTQRIHLQERDPSYLTVPFVER